MIGEESNVKRPILLAALAALIFGGLWAASSVVGADDDRRAGDVIKIEDQPDGSKQIHRVQADGEVIIEHQEQDGEVWFESNEVLGHDGEPVICPNGEPLRIDLEAEPKHPSSEEFNRASRGLPEGKSAAYNEYTGEFEIVDSVKVKSNSGPGPAIAMAGEPHVYKCDSENQPTLVPLSEVDPEAGREARENAKQFLQDLASGEGGGITGLGQENPAAGVAKP